MKKIEFKPTRFQLALIFIGLAFLAGILFRLLTPKTPEIISYQPDPNLPLSLTDKFTVTTKETLADPNNILFSLSPNTEIEVSQDQNTYTIIPQIILSPSTTYTLNVYFKNKLFRQIVYQTKTLKDISPEEDQALQTQADDYYAGQLDQVYNQKPWLDKLPLIAAKYTAIYDSARDGINIHIKHPLTEKEKADILKNLQSQGIPIDKVLWIQPTPTP